MIIGVDAGVLGGRDKSLQTGVYISAANLFREIKKLDKNNEYLFYSFKPLDKKLLTAFPIKSKNIVLPSMGWFYLWLPLVFLKRRPDIFLAISQAMPWYHPFPTIGFIHGLDFSKTFHEYGNNLEKLQRNTIFLAKHASTLVTTSTFLKNSIEKKYKKQNVVVVPLGVDSKMFHHTKKNTFTTPYFLFVGSIKPSKNIPTILKSFSHFLKNTKQPCTLICIGSMNWVDKSVEKLIHELGLKNNVILHAPVSQSELHKYYKGAVAFVSPSLYEGFGLPFLEAMASGCPVIGSNVGGIKEIVGDSGLLFNPTDTKAIAKGMQDVATNKILRNKLIMKGRKQAEKFTWERHAKKIYSIIKSYENTSK